VRLPLNADMIIEDAVPKIKNIHNENKEITLYTKGFTPKYSDVIGRMVGAMQEYRISVLLDVHLLMTSFDTDAFWYYPTYSKIENTKAYQAAVKLATNYCSATYWNILGVDLKNAMTDARWTGTQSDAEPKSDWQNAAQAIADKMLELCPQWLVFVGGASSPSIYESFDISNVTAKHWNGGNLHNATQRPIKLSTANKLVYAPQAHSHGVLPQTYFFNPSSKCGPTVAGTTVQTTDCVLIINGQLTATTKKMMRCQDSGYSCLKYSPLPKTTLETNYKNVLSEAIGNIVQNGSAPVIFGQFSGVYGTTQPQQTIALDYLINFASKSLSGGYYASLNPEIEYYLEAPINISTGANQSSLIGKVHYGLMSATSWQIPNADLLTALSAMPSSDIPCYGDLKPGPPSTMVESSSNQVFQKPILLGFIFSAMYLCL